MEEVRTRVEEVDPIDLLLAMSNEILLKQPSVPPTKPTTTTTTTISPTPQRPATKPSLPTKPTRPATKPTAASNVDAAWDEVNDVLSSLEALAKSDV